MEALLCSSEGSASSRLSGVTRPGSDRGPAAPTLVCYMPGDPEIADKPPDILDLLRVEPAHPGDGPEEGHLSLGVAARIGLNQGFQP